ncbi:MAG: ATP/GTP-binding protein [Candidatus Jordarchaeales archaeon]
MFIVPFFGFAGSGKTSLTKTFGRFLNEKGYSVMLVNLDPGVEELPYEPDFDVRSIFTISDIMREEGIGPNLAMLRASERILAHYDHIVSEIRGRGCEFVLVDTPGQLEIFAFREAGGEFMRRLREFARVCGVFLIGCDLASTLSKFIVAIFVGLAVQLSLGVETITVLHKSDMDTDGRIRKLISDDKLLKLELMKETGVIADVASIALEVLSKIRPAKRIISTSSVTMEGHEELFELLHEVFCVCGDNL